VVLLEELLGDPGALPALVGALGLDPGRTPPPPEAVNASTGDAPVLEPGLERTLKGYVEESNAQLAALLERPLPW
jgi:hypothetical protein